MDDNLKSILAKKEAALEQEKLLQYMNGMLSTEEQHQLESIASDDPFAADAMEGLSTIANKEDLPNTISSINSKLKKQLHGNKPGKRKAIPSQQWAIYAILIIIVLTAAAYALLLLIK